MYAAWRFQYSQILPSKIVPDFSFCESDFCIKVIKILQRKFFQRYVITVGIQFLGLL